MRIDRVKFAAALARADMTTIELSQRAGLSRGTISSVKNGKKCTPKTAQRIAFGLGVELSELATGEEE